MPPKKKLAAIIKLQIQAGAANPAPPVGPALGQHGVNIMEFCKAYNAATESQRGQVDPGRDHGLRGPLVHLHHQDAAGRAADPQGRRGRQGLRRPRTRSRSPRSPAAQVREIAETKMPDLNANDIDAAEKIIAGTARRWASPSRTERPTVTDHVGCGAHAREHHRGRASFGPLTTTPARRRGAAP